MTELNTAAMPDAPETPLDRERWLSEAKEFVEASPIKAPAPEFGAKALKRC